MARPKRPSDEERSLSQARASLSDLVREIQTLRKVAITVHGDVKAWLVAPDLEPGVKRPRRPLRGSLKIVGDIESFDASAELEKAAIRRAKRAGLI